MGYLLSALSAVFDTWSFLVVLVVLVLYLFSRQSRSGWRGVFKFTHLPSNVLSKLKTTAKFHFYGEDERPHTPRDEEAEAAKDRKTRARKGA